MMKRRNQRHGSLSRYTRGDEENKRQIWMRGSCEEENLLSFTAKQLRKTFLLASSKLKSCQQNQTKPNNLRAKRLLISFFRSTKPPINNDVMSGSDIFINPK